MLVEINHTESHALNSLNSVATKTPSKSKASTYKERVYADRIAVAILFICTVLFAILNS